MILLCGSLGDRVLAYTLYMLEKSEHSYCFIDELQYPKGYEINWRYNNGRPHGKIKSSDFDLDLSEITGIYVRHVSPEQEDKLNHSKLEYLQALDLIINSAPCKVVNRAHSQLSNGSKPYQSLILRRNGFYTPRTLITNVPGEVEKFIQRCNGKVIFKSISGVRSIVQEVNACRFEDIGLVENCVTQFQEYIEGTEVRVHVVDNEIFATEIISEATDYRYASREGHETKMKPVTLPKDISDKCIEVTKSLGLTMSGIDLRRTPSGDYYCFEVNPSPGYSYYELNTGQQISRALIDILRN